MALARPSIFAPRCLFLSSALCLFLCLFLPSTVSCTPESSAISTPQEALDYLNNTPIPDSSVWWPNIRRGLFLENLKANLLSPWRLYQGTNTNFCGYAALTWLPLHDDPLTYVRFLMTLYIDGEATWGSIHFRPSREIYPAAGTLRFKGILDVRPADQLWFLILADHLPYLSVRQQYLPPQKKPQQIQGPVSNPFYYP